jgi:hypothetical protein
MTVGCAGSWVGKPGTGAKGGAPRIGARVIEGSLPQPWVTRQRLLRTRIVH